MTGEVNKPSLNGMYSISLPRRFYSALGTMVTPSPAAAKPKATCNSLTPENELGSILRSSNRLKTKSIKLGRGAFGYNNKFSSLKSAIVTIR